MTQLGLRKPGRAINGKFVRRGEWVVISASAFFVTCCVADVFVRGSGGGHGGNVKSPSETVTGQRGKHGSGNTWTSVTVTGEVTVSLGPAGSSAASKTHPGDSSVIGANDGTSGASCSITSNNFGASRSGGDLGNGATLDGWNGQYTQDYDDWQTLIITNPAGGNYGRMGGQNYTPPNYYTSAAVRGCVQLLLIDQG
ncbi:hypothetical protein [Gilvimarinus agarilyticus]|uniref:hypothetical protein n=1 Tax=Gilvimarinus agarilyticus TaxID=679259 RepID=UPI0005A28E6D|nr:hypothetical protein [Gilvimarinus agarilyticus]